MFLGYHYLPGGERDNMWFGRNVKPRHRSDLVAYDIPELGAGAEGATDADGYKMFWEIPFDKPIVTSEFGGGALAGRHGRSDERWTEEMQKAIYEANIRMFSRIDGLCGTCPWVPTCFRSPRRPLSGVQDWHYRKGLFAPDGTEKLAAGVLREFYSLLAGRWKE